MGYKPETDLTTPLSPELLSYYQSLIGIIRWMVDIGIINITTEVSLLSSHNSYPQEKHFEKVLHVMGYLKLKHNYRLAIYPNYPPINNDNYESQDWTAFYGDVQEAIPINVPAPRGKAVVIQIKVDSDHAGNLADRHSRTCYMIYVQMALIFLLSKKQATFDKAVFGSDFVDMTHGVKTLHGLRFKFRMIGVPVYGPTSIFGDNISVIFNTSRPDSQLKKKSNSICYQIV